MHDRTDILNWRIIPHITVDDANAAIAFYERTFGARVIHRYTVPDGDKILHAALDFHGAELFLSDDFPEYSRQPSSPAALGGSPVLLHLDVPDV
ncbi:MAG: VOC family protein, partial [Candidatus Eremiobacteraeota bacterium]|nr:VOC family protein [Candidatus Eremiobacteraeota bacterium]